jgi:hypothetical protein
MLWKISVKQAFELTNTGAIIMGVGNFSNPFGDYGDILILDYTNILKGDKVEYIVDDIKEELNCMLATTLKPRHMHTPERSSGMLQFGDFGGGFGALSLYAAAYYADQYIVGVALNSSLRDFISQNSNDDVSVRDYAANFKAEFGMRPSDFMPRASRGLDITRDYLKHKFAEMGFEIRKATTAYTTVDIAPENPDSGPLRKKLIAWDTALSNAFDKSNPSKKPKPRF